MKVVDRIEGPRGEVIVYENGNLRSMCFADNPKLTQAAMYTDRPLAYRSEFIGLMLAGLAAVEAPRRLLLLGLGGGGMARLAMQACPEATIDVVEIDPAVVTAAERWFGLEPSDRLRVHVSDAAAWLRSQEDRFDLAWVDCFDARQVPAHLTTRAFAERVAGAADVVCANLVRTHATYETLLRRWRQVLRRPLRIEGRRSTNHIILGAASRLVEMDRELAEQRGVWAAAARATPIPC